jgi:serine O-acetyltransferase
VNIGAALNNSDATPVLGDNCYIAPGAKIFGAVILGDYSQIGANAVVNKSFPESGHVLVGIPARSVRKIGERLEVQNKE